MTSKICESRRQIIQLNKLHEYLNSSSIAPRNLHIVNPFAKRSGKFALHRKASHRSRNSLFTNLVTSHSIDSLESPWKIATRLISPPLGVSSASTFRDRSDILGPTRARDRGRIREIHSRHRLRSFPAIDRSFHERRAVIPVIGALHRICASQVLIERLLCRDATPASYTLIPL